MKNKKKCFVIMPVSQTKSCTEDEWTGIFEHMIKPTVKGSKLGFDCERAKPLTGAFIKDILEGLNRADVVIADLTDKNPNVCYELGIRHTLKKRTILIVQDINDVPSDLRSYWVVTYDKDLAGADEFKKKVRGILREMQKDPEKSDSPVADFIKQRNIDFLSFEKKNNLAKLSALLSELSYNIDAADSILNTVKLSEEAREKNATQFKVSNERFSNTSMELLLSTSYVTFSSETLRNVKAINEKLQNFNRILDLWCHAVFTKNVEKQLKDVFPTLREALSSLLKQIDEVRIEYASDNYQEPETPIILLASTKHQEYLKST